MFSSNFVYKYVDHRLILLYTMIFLRFEIFLGYVPDYDSVISVHVMAARISIRINPVHDIL